MSRPGGVTGSIRLIDRFGTGNRQRMVFLRGDSLSAIRCCLILAGLVMLVGFAGAYSYTFQTTDNAMQINVSGSWHSSPWTVDYWPDGQSTIIMVPCSQYTSTESKYVFTSWSGKSTSKSPKISFITEGQTAGTYTANYIKRYYLTVTSNPPISSIPGTGWYDEGKTVHLTAPAVDGYSFDKWLVGGKGVGNKPTIDITMDNAHLVIAEYKATTGWINVASTPSGASVYLDGSSKGPSPMTIASVSPGTHMIKLTVSGYEDWQQSVHVVAGQTTTVNAHMMVAALLNGSGVGFFRPSMHRFTLKNGTKTTNISWGISTDTPVTGDWNGDGLADVGVFRPAIHRFILKNGSAITNISWGISTDLPISGDWNGDGLWDVGVYRPSTHWFYLKNGTATTGVRWGLSGDIPVTSDWNGDGLWDVGVWRNSTKSFYLKTGTSNRVVNAGSWSLPTDIPVTGKWR